MNASQPLTWTYDSDADAWKTDDGVVSIEGAIVRQWARQHLRARRTTALSQLESLFGPAPSADVEPLYRAAVVNVLSAPWPQALAS